MSSTGLYEIVELDPNDPELRAAQEDAAGYERLIDSLVTQRRALKLTQTEVAFRMKTAQSAVSDLERLGGDARYSTLQRYARAVGASMHSEIRFDVKHSHL